MLTRSRKRQPDARRVRPAQRHPYWAEENFTIGPARVRGPSRLLLWCAGVDRELLRTGAEVLRYSGLGALVIAVATLGATTFTIFGMVVIGRFHWYLAPFGVLWGLVILLIDRAIVTEPHYRERTASRSFSAPDRPATGSAWLGNGTQANGTHANGTNGNGTHGYGANGYGTNGNGDASDHAGAKKSALIMNIPSDSSGWALRGLVYALRLVITACIAYLVAEAAMLLIFHPEVTAELAQLHVAQFQQARNADLAKNQADLASLGTIVSNAQQAVAAKQKLVNQDIGQAAAEEGGKGTGPLGPTSGTRGTGSTYQQDISKLHADQVQLGKLQAQAAADQKNYQTLKAELVGADQGDPKDLQALGIGSVRADIDKNNGLNEQEHAFSLFVKANQDDLLATAGPWILRVLLIAIDLIPLSTKLLNRYTIYGRRMSERALIIRYHDVNRDNAIMRDIDQQAAIHALRTQHDYEVDTERAGWRRFWQMGFMRYPD